MKAYRIEISSWTASFRYPNIISGYQPTLRVPPLSTVLGLINACAGQYLAFKDEEIGYYFDYQAVAEDLEKIYQVKTNKGVPNPQVKANVLHREFLYDCRLFVYLRNPDIVDFFRHPYFQIMLGRSNDLATVCDIREIEMPRKECANHICGQIVPFAGNSLPGVIQALPQYFTNTIPRENIGTRPYSVIDHTSDTVTSSLVAYTDFIDEKEVDILFHKINV